MLIWAGTLAASVAYKLVEDLNAGEEGSAPMEMRGEPLARVSALLE